MQEEPLVLLLQQEPADNSKETIAFVSIRGHGKEVESDRFIEETNNLIQTIRKSRAKKVVLV